MHPVCAICGGRTEGHFGHERTPIFWKGVRQIDEIYQLWKFDFDERTNNKQNLIGRNYSTVGLRSSNRDRNQVCSDYWRRQQVGIRQQSWFPISIPFSQRSSFLLWTLPPSTYVQRRTSWQDVFNVQPTPYRSHVGWALRASAWEIQGRKDEQFARRKHSKKQESLYVKFSLLLVTFSLESWTKNDRWGCRGVHAW